MLTQELVGQLQIQLICLEVVVTLRARAKPRQEEQMQNIQLPDLKVKVIWEERKLLYNDSPSALTGYQPFEAYFLLTGY